MSYPPIPSSEPLRLAALKALNILDTEAEREFDVIVELASRICQTPVSLITLVDAERQWFKANKGFGLKETPRDISFCAHAINEPQPMVVTDASRDERFSNNPLVTSDPGISFYAGVPLHNDEGLALGTLCVIDHQPRMLTEEQLYLLEALSKQVEVLLKLRLKIFEADRLNKALHQEILERKKLEGELTEARQQAEQSAKAKELFLANMSHEIRTPMNAITGMVGQLSKTELTEGQQFYVQTIQTAADNLLVVINDVLDLSKIEAGKLTIEQIAFEPRLVIERAMQVMRLRAEEKGLLLSHSFVDPQLGAVLIGDPYRLNQVLLNLLSNAIKFTDRGFVDVSCRVLQDSATHQTVRCQVSDSGIGMEEPFRNSLFEKFTQEDGSISRRYGGTGLGMSICKEIVGLMGGTIEVESQKNRGTTVSFTITFEKGVAEQVRPDAPEHTDPGFLSGKKILVADDNEMNRLLASTLLANWGVVTREAQHGAEAVEKLKEEPFDAVLMDVQMPVMDGLEATAIIRRQLGDSLPIIALTAFALKGDDEKLIAAGMSDYLSKPFDEGQLLQVLARWLRDKEKQTPAEQSYSETEPLYSLREIRRIAQGNIEFVHKMITLFIEQAPATAREMQEACRTKDLKKLGELAHRLTPSIDTMDLRSIKDTIREIEQLAAEEKALPHLEELVSRVAAVVNQVATQLKQEGTGT